MDDSELKKKLNDGWMLITCLFEIIGNPKEHVKKSMDLVVKNISDNPDIEVVDSDLGEPEEVQGDLHGCFWDADLLVKKLDTLSWLCFNFMPASIEVKEPSKLSMTDKNFSDFMNDLLASMHESNQKFIETTNMNKHLQRNINAILRNAILVALREDTLSSDEIGKLIGISGDQIIPVLDALIKENRIDKVSDDKYKRK